MRAERGLRRWLAPALLALASCLAAGCAPSDGGVGGRIVHRQKSMYRDIIVVEADGYRCMSFGRGSYFQSCILIDAPDMLAVPYARGMFAALGANPGARRVLMIGLGGGVIPRALRRIDPTMEIDVVELDPAVVEVAKRHFGYREDARLRTVIGDGRVFVRRQARAGVRYDMVMIDAFERVYVPEHMITREFIAEVESLLAPGGTMTSNTFSRGALAPYEAATYQSVFGETRILDIPGGSRVILAGRDPLPPTETLRRNAAALQTRFHAIGIMARELDSRPQPKAVGQRLLTDRYSPANLLFYGE